MDAFLEKWVQPFYLKGLMGSDVAALRGALNEVEPAIVEQLLAAENWREQIVGSYFAGLRGWNQFEETIGQMLLASQLCYAGEGHCFALARFADDASRGHLIAYLDHYLRQPDLFYDQHGALPALLWIDERHGTQYAAPYLAPGGLWETFTADKNDAWRFEGCRERFWRIIHYCQESFDATKP